MEYRLSYYVPLLDHAFFSWFVPESLRQQGGLEEQRARLVVLLSLLVIVNGPIFALIYHLLLDATALSYGMVLASVVAMGGPLLLRRTGSFVQAGNWLCACLMATLLYLTFFTGGLAAPALQWTFLVPMAALILSGQRSGIGWAVFTGLVVCGIWASQSLGYTYTQILGPERLQLLEAFGLLGSLSLSFGLIWLHSTIDRWLKASLERRELELRGVVEHAADGIVMIDEAGRIDGLNSAAEEVLGAGAALGEPIGVSVPALAGAEGPRGIVALCDGARTLYEARAPDGGVTPIEVSAGLYSVFGVERCVMIVHDVSMRRARDEALEASRHKSVFLANMSHELRTPLNAIIGYTEMMAEEAAEREDDHLLPDLGRVQTAGKHLLRIISDVLDLSRIEAGGVEVSYRETDLDGLFDEVIAIARPLIEEGVTLHERRGTQRLGSLHTDPTKLRQILLNLLSNACKFTSVGEITLTATRTSGALTIEVEDTGIGMDPADVERVFLPFQQADTSTTRRYDGTGLGLAITRHYCEMLGGRIVVESEVGVGTKFVVELET